MWLITNLKTGEERLFKSVEDWQNFVAYRGLWDYYSVKYMHIS